VYGCLALAGSTHDERVEALSWAVRKLPAFGRHPAARRRRRAILDLVLISAAFRLSDLERLGPQND
jgi:hypothetical protein